MMQFHTFGGSLFFCLLQVFTEQGRCLCPHAVKQSRMQDMPSTAAGLHLLISVECLAQGHIGIACYRS